MSSPIPRLYGRCWVKPVALFVRQASTTRDGAPELEPADAQAELLSDLSRAGAVLVVLVAGVAGLALGLLLAGGRG